MNHLHRYLLIEAEKYRVLGNGVKAMEYFDRAIGAAGENGYSQEKALASERAAEFHLAQDRKNIARFYIMEALYEYGRLGALAKTRQF